MAVIRILFLFQIPRFVVRHIENPGPQSLGLGLFPGFLGQPFGIAGLGAVQNRQRGLVASLDRDLLRPRLLAGRIEPGQVAADP